MSQSNKLNEIVSYNQTAWDKQVDAGNEWTKPVSSEEIAAAQEGDWEIILTPSRVVPREWFGDFQAKDVLCLASGGGQQGPILAAAGANVTVFDNSPKQLEQDTLVAERDGLELKIVQGDMRDLSMFADSSFDLIVNPVSNCFCPELQPVWNECFRVLKTGGSLLSGYNNPAVYIFDIDKLDKGEFEVKHSLPYSDVESFTDAKLARYKEQGWPLEFSHSYESQLSGQIQAGFAITGFYEDYWREDRIDTPLNKHMPSFFANKATKF